VVIPYHRLPRTPSTQPAARAAHSGNV
jgi:hypothetical protein